MHGCGVDASLIESRAFLLLGSGLLAGVQRALRSPASIRRSTSAGATGAVSVTDEAKGTSPSFKAHMLALGRLCIVWAYIDRLLNDAIQAVLGCTHGQAASIGTEAHNVASRCRLLRLLAFEADLPDEWRKVFLALLDRIGAQGERRNRYVHDYWTVADGTLEKMDRRASVRKAQAGEAPQLMFNTWQATPPGDVNNLSADLTLTALCLQTAIADLTTWKREGQLEGRAMLLQMGLARVDQKTARSRKPKRPE